MGVVRQTETAALKAVGSNRNTPFKRELTQMITKGTVVNDMISSDQHTSSYLMCLVEENKGGNGRDDRVSIGMVAIQPTTGDIIYDTFEDTFMRSELETRLLHIEPNELLLHENTSKPTEKVVKHLSFGGDENVVRIERIPEKDVFCQDYDEASTFVSEFYEESSSTLPKLPNIVM